MSISSPRWRARPEAGTRTALRIVILIGRLVPRPVLRAFLYPVALYYYVIRRPERQASRDYLSRVFERPARASEVFKHILSFAQVTADRIYFLTGRVDRIPISWVGEPAARRLVGSTDAGVFLAAHMGSFEAARVTGLALGHFKIKIVVDALVNPTFRELMEDLDPELGLMTIDAEQDAVSLGLKIADAIRAGTWIGFLADRMRKDDRHTVHTFLGAPAAFPRGPYDIANAVRTPIVAMFCRLEGNGYDLHFEILSDGVRFDRKHREEQLRELSAEYVRRLESHVRASPYSWFNFYDFWAGSS